MTRVYHKCHFCGGEVVEKKITIDYRWGEELIALIENVPTGVCQICGEQYLKAEIVNRKGNGETGPVTGKFQKADSGSTA